MDFYMGDLFEFQGKMFGQLLLKDNPNFEHFVEITKITKKHTNWMTVDPDLEKQAKKYFKKNIKKKK